MTEKLRLPTPLRRPPRKLIWLASTLAVSAMMLFALGLFHPKPLTVILSMSLGHILVGMSVAIYVLVVILDSRERPGWRVRRGPGPQRKPEVPTPIPHE